MNQEFGNANHGSGQGSKSMGERGPLRHGGHGNHGHRYSNRGTYRQADSNVNVSLYKTIFSDFRMEKSADDGSGHTRSRHDHAAPCGIRVASARQSENEGNGSEEIRGLRNVGDVGQ